MWQILQVSWHVLPSRHYQAYLFLRFGCFSQLASVTESMLPKCPTETPDPHLELGIGFLYALFTLVTIDHGTLQIYCPDAEFTLPLALILHLRNSPISSFSRHGQTPLFLPLPLTFWVGLSLLEQGVRLLFHWALEPQTIFILSQWFCFIFTYITFLST